MAIDSVLVLATIAKSCIRYLKKKKCFELCRIHSNLQQFQLTVASILFQSINDSVLFILQTNLIELQNSLG